MRHKVLIVAAALGVAYGSAALAQPIEGGQYPAPPAVASRSALPLCGFAATESWGTNGFAYCDPRNIYGRSDGGYRSRYR